MSRQPTFKDTHPEKTETEHHIPQQRVMRTTDTMNPNHISKSKKSRTPKLTANFALPDSKDLEAGQDDTMGYRWKLAMEEKRKEYWKRCKTPCILLLLVAVVVVIGVFLIPWAIRENKESRKAACEKALEIQHTYVINKLHCKPSA
ncbi:hypothetical protein BZA77DRAFT_391097 [Pyronema omphalodes]|nr:hypothetical protein BZA77DRAFT_391097 [Pyronema omphalodes]